MTPFLEVGIRKSQGEFRLEVDLRFPRGWGALFGRSGAGKTTVLRCIAGVLEPDDGEIRIGGKVIYSRKLGIDEIVRRRGIGMVPAGGGLFPHLAVRENLLFGTRRAKASSTPSFESVVEVLEIQDLLERRPKEISSGERQRVAMGRAMLSGPTLLLLDEPLAGLDDPLRRKIIRFVARIKEEFSLPCLYVTHSLGEVLTLCDHVAVLEGGRVIGQGPPLEVLTRPRSLVVAGLTGVENILALEVLEHRQEDGITRLRLGEQVLDIPLSKAAVGGRVRIGFRAEDVIVAVEPPGPTSARNVLRGKILSLEEEGGEVRVTVTCGEEVLARITPGSRRSLGLQEGKEVTLLLKTHSCHVLE